MSCSCLQLSGQLSASCLAVCQLSGPGLAQLSARQCRQGCRCTAVVEAVRDCIIGSNESRGHMPAPIWSPPLPGCGKVQYRQLCRQCMACCLASCLQLSGQLSAAVWPAVCQLSSCLPAVWSSCLGHAYFSCLQLSGRALSHAMSGCRMCRLAVNGYVCSHLNHRPAPSSLNIQLGFRS